MAKDPTNKLSIYLIKKGYSDPKDIFKDYKKLESERIQDVGNFYYGDSHRSAPAWIKKFFDVSFENSSGDNNLKIFTASSKAVLLVASEKRKFALTFGYGYILLTPGAWEERFGLKVALNVIDSENLRSIDKKNMSVVPKLSKEQITKDGTFYDFGIDIEQDLVQGITAKSKYENYGKSVTGKDALSVSVKIDISTIKNFLKDCYQSYNSHDYKENFGWIDHAYEIKDPKTVDALDSKLIEGINKKEFDTIWMSIPEIVDWSDVSEFKLGKQSFRNDIDLPTYLKFLSDAKKQNLSIDTLKNQIIQCVSASTDNTIHQWKVYNCLYSEITNGNEIHILSSGKWYKIEGNYAKQISRSFDSLKKQSMNISLPKCNQSEHEDQYNQRAAEILSDTCSMDRKIINHGGANQKIEFCDLYTKDKKLIHVKHYGSSSVLSHLFSQGLVSGELFLSDPEFRKKLNEKLPNDYKIENTEEKPNASEYEIVYAIISKSDKELDIPFFSKVNIRNAKRRLETFGYTVSLQKIPTSVENN